MLIGKRSRTFYNIVLNLARLIVSRIQILSAIFTATFIVAFPNGQKSLHLSQHAQSHMIEPSSREVVMTFLSLFRKYKIKL